MICLEITWKSDNNLSSCLLSSRLLCSLITIRCHFILTVSLTRKLDETSDWEWSCELRAPSDTLSFPSISLPTLAGNLVRKLFCVCLWTMQSQVRLIQKETQHKRSYACSDDCCYSAAVVEYFPLSPFPLQKTPTRHTNQSVSQHKRSDLLRITLKLFFTFKRTSSVQGPSDHPGLFIIQTIIPHLLADLQTGLFYFNACKWKGDHGTQSSWGFPLALHVCQLCSDSLSWPFGFWA